MNRNTKENQWWDYTWNPIAGCSPISEGCQNCYAAGMSKRFGWPWGAATFHLERLEEPIELKKPSRIFVCSMGDFFHASVNTVWIDNILEVMAACPEHTFMVLTKRAHLIEPKLYEVTAENPCRELGEGDYLPNLWLGATIETQAHEQRIFFLLSIPAAVHFVSVEPMLEPVSLKRRVDFVIAGPETGQGARPCRDEWIDALAAESPCFFDKRKNGTRREFPNSRDAAQGK